MFNTIDCLNEPSTRVYSHVANVLYERGPATYRGRYKRLSVGIMLLLVWTHMYMYYSSVMNNCSLFVSPVIFLFHQGYIICPIVTHLMLIYNAPCLLRVRSYLGLYNVCSVSVISIASSHSKKTASLPVILQQALKSCRNRLLWSTMTTRQWWVNVAVISPTLN